MKISSWGWALRAGSLGLCALTLPRLLLGVPAPSQVELARSVAGTVASGVAASNFHTGSERFDGEWAFGTFLMSTLGLGQVLLAHPEQRPTLLPAMQRSVRELISDRANAFGTAAWGNRGLATLTRGEGHGYLGYANLALSMLRLVEPDNHYAALSDELTEALAQRLASAPHALFETYPGETYTPDMAMVAGSIGLHDCALGLPERAFFPAWRATFSRYVAESGLLYQAADAQNGKPVDSPRGSGTAISAYALSFVDARLSRQLYDGLRRQAVSALGFGMMREYAAAHIGGRGDIDSGPVLLGVGVSATGFALAAARLHRDHQLFESLYRTVNLFGVPLHDPGRWHFMSGGPLGNAILLAMTSASFDWSQHCRKVAP